MPRIASRLCRLCIALTVSIITLTVLFDLRRARDFLAVPHSPLFHSRPACPRSPLLDDILVVVRTGATEVREKLPVHFQTVLACVPDYVIYSDLEEDIEGHHVHDVLDQVPDHYRRTAPEFALYNKLRESGRQGLEYQTSFGSGPTGALDNPGWKLDKWKFLPMLDRALQHRPHAKWFVFIEPDTYMIWQNVLEYLRRFEPGEDLYIGTPMYIGEVLFAHGGSGFMVSNIAMRTVLQHWKDNRDWYDQYTAKEWAGDMVLGRAMKDAHIDLFAAVPHFQGQSLTGVDWTVNKHDKPTWCYTPLTFHHMTEPEFHLMWQFEETWLRRNRGKTSPRFQDVFRNVIQPQLRSRLDGWDNMATGTEYSDEAFAKLSDDDKLALSEEERRAQVSFEACQAVCESKPSCIQFSHAPRKCIISNELRLGHAAESQCLEYSRSAGKCVRTGADGAPDGAPDKESTVSSGWIMKRVSASLDQMDKACESPELSGWAHFFG